MAASNLVTESIGQRFCLMPSPDEIPGVVDGGMQLLQGHRTALGEECEGEVTQRAPGDRFGTGGGGRNGGAPMPRRTASMGPTNPGPEHFSQSAKFADQFTAVGGERRQVIVQIIETVQKMVTPDLKSQPLARSQRRVGPQHHPVVPTSQLKSSRGHGTGPLSSI